VICARAGSRGGSRWYEWVVDRQEPFLMDAAARPTDLPGRLPDLERSDRILGKLGPVWRRVPDWALAWLIVNLVPAGSKASDAELELGPSARPRSGMSALAVRHLRRCDPPKTGRDDRSRPRTLPPSLCAHALNVAGLKLMPSPEPLDLKRPALHRSRRECWHPSPLEPCTKDKPPPTGVHPPEGGCVPALWHLLDRLHARNGTLHANDDSNTSQVCSFLL
jgi:hypothetical protein